MGDGGSGKVDVVVVGAGISGIFAAKFYLDVHPDCKLLVLERDVCVGGTWNKRRSYDSFWTQWTVGAAEFSDFPMERPPEEDIYYELFKAKHTTSYLESYVDHQIHSGKSLRSRIQFSTEVQSIIKTDGEWSLSTRHRVTGAQETIQSSKVIITSGLTSIPNMPSLPGKEDFQGQVLHHEDFGASNVLSSPEVQHITVLGGGKSSADMVYSSVKAGKTVSWILKETETTGPGVFLSPKGMGPYKSAFEIGMTRVAATFVPSFMNGYPWWRWLLHSSKLGVKLMTGFWGTIDKDALKEGNFDGRESLEGFEKLRPHCSIFWENGTGGFLNHADFFDTISENVRIHCADIMRLEKGHLRLKNGDAIKADAILCGTGWISSLQFFSQDQSRQLGLPHLLAAESAQETSHWSQLADTADKEVITTFPQLAAPPPHWHRPVTETPYRLYKNIAPLSHSISDDDAQDRTIVFVGLVGVGNYFPVIECQSMWATAYMDGKLKIPGRAEQEKEVAMFNAWCRRRYLSNGEPGNNMTFELMGYCDGLLQALGLSSHRKGWLSNLFKPFVASDYAGLRDEYIKKYGQEVNG